jgi:hypothetical protein
MVPLSLLDITDTQRRERRELRREGRKEPRTSYRLMIGYLAVEAKRGVVHLSKGRKGTEDELEFEDEYDFGTIAKLEVGGLEKLFPQERR